MKLPIYLDLSKKGSIKKIERLFKILENCEICPRKCHINRLKGKIGFCQLGSLPVVSAHNPRHPHLNILNFLEEFLQKNI